MYIPEYKKDLVRIVKGELVPVANIEKKILEEPKPTQDYDDTDDEEETE